ncbi:MAG: hypothetical protein EPN76_14005 [Burkholderiaceae bacterium]|nr:MAG: hypothetical protein EPN76_14005 [Burkholderiaceae bacterium]
MLKVAKFGCKRAAHLTIELGFLQDETTLLADMRGRLLSGLLHNLQLSRLTEEVSVRGLDVLRSITEVDSGVRVGATGNHTEIEDVELPSLASNATQCASQCGGCLAMPDRDIVGGYQAHADPTANWALTSTPLHYEVVSLGGATT